MIICDTTIIPQIACVCKKNFANPTPKNFIATKTLRYENIDIWFSTLCLRALVAGNNNRRLGRVCNSLHTRIYSFINTIFTACAKTKFAHPTHHFSCPEPGRVCTAHHFLYCLGRFLRCATRCTRGSILQAPLRACPEEFEGIKIGCVLLNPITTNEHKSARRN